MGVSKNRGTPKWMVYNGGNPIFKWMIWGENPPFFGKTYMLLIFFYSHIPLGSWTQFVKHVYQVGCSTPVDVYFWTIHPQKSMGLVSFYLRNAWWTSEFSHGINY